MRDFEGRVGAPLASDPVTTTPKVVEEEQKGEEPRIEEVKT